MKGFLKYLPILVLIAFGACGYWLLDHWTQPVHAQQAYVGFRTYADISGTSGTVQFSSTVGSACRAIQLIAPSGNTHIVRWGDSSTGASQGGIIAAGAGQFLPPLPVTGGSFSLMYDLTKLYTYVQTGDSLTVICIL